MGEVVQVKRGRGRPLTEEHKAALAAGRKKWEKSGAPRKARTPRTVAPFAERISMSGAGELQIYEPDMKHGMTIEPADARTLFEFLSRVLRGPYGEHQAA